MKALITFLLLFLSNQLLASEQNPSSLSYLEGFNYQGKVINPKCVNLLQVWGSESPEYGIIAKSIIIDSCQDSNLAFEGKNFTTDKKGTITYYEDPKDGRSSFSYRVVGRTLNNIFVLFHSGYIGLYKLEEQDVIFDFSKKEKTSVTVLSKLSETWTPCFQSAHIIGNKIIINKFEWDSSTSRANQCTKVNEKLVFDLHNL